MSNHTNKLWLREKEYISLIKERRMIWDSLPRYRRLYSGNRTNSRLVYINQKLEHKFFNEFRGMYHTAPWWYRNMLNRSQRAKSKLVLHKIMKGDEDYIFEDNYKDAPWYW